jgi:3-deoxy-D-manno-octulosonic-acid transferase
MLRLYNAALWPLRGAAEILARLRARDGASRREWAERLGRSLAAFPCGGIWIHGASVGEARLVVALAAALRRASPGTPLHASAVTREGRSRLPTPPAADRAIFAPLDFPGPVRRTFAALRPDALVLVETELWPNLLAVARHEGVPVCVVNARLAPERLARYRRLRRLYAPLLSEIAAVGAQDEEQVGRFVALGVPSSRVERTGNLKYDLAPPEETRESVRARLGVAPDRPVLIAGSTAEDEEGQILDAFAAVRARVPGALLVLAPRRPARFAAAGETARARGYRVARRSTNEPAGEEADVCLVDLLGELALLYTAADAAFVGGTLVPIGGHNLLEPAAAGVPVAFGPHTAHVGEPAEALLTAEAGARVADSSALARVWIRWIEDPAERRRVAEAGRALVARNRGALDRTVALVLRAAGGSR